MRADTASGGEPPPPNGTAPSGRQQESSLKDIAETFVTYFGIPALVLYPVGLFVVATQLWVNTPSPFTFLTAWYATSLVPDLVVVGEGATVVLIPLAYTLIFSAFFGRLLYRVFLEEESARSTLRRFVETVFLIVVLLGFMFALPLFFWFVSATHGLVLIPSFLAGLYGGYLIARDRDEYGRRIQSGKVQSSLTFPFRSWLLRGLKERWILRGLVSSYLASFVAALLVAFLQEPALPAVTMIIDNPTDTTAYEAEEPVAVEGWLLSHQEGYWHVVQSREKIWSIPNEEVQDIVFAQ